jgi:hypothetical protein
MADMSWRHGGSARAILRAIVSDPDYGPGTLSSPRVMSHLLNDYLPDAPREKLLLLAAVDAGLAESLGEHISAGMDPATAIRLTASSLAAGTAIEPDACQWAAIEFAVALGLISDTAAAEIAAWPEQDAVSPVAKTPATRTPAPVTVAEASDENTLLPDQAPAPTSSTAVHSAPSSQSAGADQGPRRIRIGLVSGAAAAVIAVAVIVIWVSGVFNSAPRVQPLSTIIAPFTASCGPASQSFTLSGVTSSYLCKRTTSSTVDVLAYQFDNSADYQAGLASLNSHSGFLAVGASRSCPPPSGTAIGSASWHSAKYPARPGQVLECYTDQHNHLPLIVWTLPGQRAILLADDGAFGATLATLHDWWTAIGFG